MYLLATPGLVLAWGDAFIYTHTHVLIVSDQPLLTTVMVPTHGRYSGHTYTSEVRMPGGRSHAVELFSQPQVETQSSKQI